MRNLCWATTWIGVLVLTMSMGARAQTPAPCMTGNSILNGAYGWQMEGMVAAGNTAAPKVGDFIPLLTAGYLAFDGNGNFSGEHDSSLGGRLVSHNDFGTYSVNPDCTGTISFASGPGNTMAMLITDGGKEVKIFYTTTNGVTPGRLRPLATGPCSESTLSGKTYGFATRGLIGSGSAAAFPRVGGFVPFADAGKISFQLDGTVSGGDDASVGGLLVLGRTITGTYSVDPDCTGTTSMTIDGVDHSWHFVILQSVDEVFFIAIPGGLLWGGTLTVID